MDKIEANKKNKNVVYSVLIRQGVTAIFVFVYKTMFKSLRKQLKEEAYTNGA